MLAPVISACLLFKGLESVIGLALDWQWNDYLVRHLHIIDPEDSFSHYLEPANHTFTVIVFPLASLKSFSDAILWLLAQSPEGQFIPWVYPIRDGVPVEIDFEF